MSTLTDIYNQISAQDAQLLEKQAEVLKIAEEHDAAGRIMARGFADELRKIAQGPESMQWPRAASGMGGGRGETIKTGPYQTGGGKTGPSTISRRQSVVPPKPTTNIAGSFGKKQKKPVRVASL